MAKILVVDDSDFIRQGLRQDLEGAGHSVIEAVDGVDGLDKYHSTPDVQLIICDVNMPNMDGFTMCSKIAEENSGRQVPVFMLTTEASPELKAKAKTVGVKAWIIKPYAAQGLLAAVARITATP